MDRPTVVIYLEKYLTTSMTFIYRQIKSCSDDFDIIVMTSNELENLRLFPFNNIIYKSKSSFSSFFFRLKLKYINHYLPVNPKLSFIQQNYFYKQLIKKRVKLIHAHFGPSALEILPLAKKLHVPLVVTFHGYDASILLKDYIYLNNIKKLFKYAYTIAVSNSMLNELIKYGAKKEKSCVIHCGIPFEKFKGSPKKDIFKKYQQNEPIKFLQVSNFVEKKGHLYTVMAFKEILDFYPNCTLTLAGEGELKKGIIKLCNDQNIINKVYFPGKVNEIQVIDLLKESDIFLHHSVTSRRGDKEGIPTAIMEAMASGTTVISTFHSGIPELIENGKSGLLVKEKDIDNYAQKIKSLFIQHNNFNDAAKDIIKNKFNLSIEVAKIKKLYSRILENEN